MNANKTANIRTIILLVSVLVLLAGFDYLEAWTKPTVAAPNGNVAAPLNTSATAQDKLGVLGVSGLSIFNGNLNLSKNAPTIKFDDLTSNGWWIHTNEAQNGENAMYFISDRNDNGNWDTPVLENPWPLELRTNPVNGTANTDYARFSNQVRANEYCDRNGNNCWDPQTGTPGGSGGKIFTKCTNAATNDPSNVPCYEAGQMKVNDTYRVQSCLRVNTQPSQVFTGNHFMFNGTSWYWNWAATGVWYPCLDGSVVVANISL